MNKLVGRKKKKKKAESNKYPAEDWNNCLPDTEVIGKKSTLKLLTKVAIKNFVMCSASGFTLFLGAVFPKSCSFCQIGIIQYVIYVMHVSSACMQVVGVLEFLDVY